jgi:hypothetical protein
MNALSGIVECTSEDRIVEPAFARSIAPKSPQNDLAATMDAELIAVKPRP